MTETDTDNFSLSGKAFCLPRFWALVNILSLTLALLAVGAGYGRFRFGSMSAALHSLQGHALYIDDRNKSIDGVQVGSRVVADYTLTNLSSHPIRIVGATSSCTCTAIQDLPMTLASLETKVISAHITVSEHKSNLSGTLRLFTDEPLSSEITLTYTLRAATSLASEARSGH